MKGIAHEFPERLNRWMRANGINEKMLANRMHVGPVKVRSWCEGEYMPSLQDFATLCEVTKRPPEWWLGYVWLPIHDGKANDIVGRCMLLAAENRTLKLELVKMKRRGF